MWQKLLCNVKFYEHMQESVNFCQAWKHFLHWVSQNYILHGCKCKDFFYHNIKTQTGTNLFQHKIKYYKEIYKSMTQNNASVFCDISAVITKKWHKNFQNHGIFPCVHICNDAVTTLNI